MDKPLLVYVVCANEKEAEKIATKAVRQRLAACANVLGKCKSFFYWKGRFDECKEVVIVMKAVGKKYSALEKTIRALHSYENPAIVALQIARGSKEYLKWIREEAK